MLRRGLTGPKKNLTFFLSDKTVAPIRKSSLKEKSVFHFRIYSDLVIFSKRLMCHSLLKFLFDDVQWCSTLCQWMIQNRLGFTCFLSFYTTTFIYRRGLSGDCERERHKAEEKQKGRAKQQTLRDYWPEFIFYVVRIEMLFANPIFFNIAYQL